MRDELAAEMAKGFELSDNEKKILSLIWSQEPMTFFQLCAALRTANLCPSKGDKGEWAKLFKLLGDFEKQGLVNATRRNSSLITIQLSPDGANQVREFFKDKHKELCPVIEQEEEEYYDDLF